MTTRLAVVDATELTRIAIREIIRHDETLLLVDSWERVATFYTFVTHDEQVIDVVVLGDNAGDEGLEQVARKLLDARPRLRIIVLAHRFTGEVIAALREIGVLGFIHKDDELSKILISAIHAVMNGQVISSPNIFDNMILVHPPQPRPTLSRKQITVLNYMADGLETRQIALKMNISVSAIYNLQQRLREKLDVSHTYQIVPTAIKLGIIQERDAS